MKDIRPSGFACWIKTACVLAALLLLAISCGYEAQFVDTTDSSRVYGDYNTFTKTISVTLASESFTGRYYPLDPADLGLRQGSLFNRNDVSTYLGLTAPARGWQDWRAVLKGGRGGTMEVIFRYNSSRATGYGIARTGSGGEYRVSLGEGLRYPARQYAPAARPPGYY